MATLKKIEILAAHKAVVELLQGTKDAPPATLSAKLRYALVVNRRRLEEVVKDLSDVEKELLKDYIAEVKTLVDDQDRVIEGKIEEFKAVQEKYADKLKEREDLLKSDTEIDLHLISLSEIPDDIETIQIERMFPLIKE